jgi:hypothetical protein
MHGVNLAEHNDRFLASLDPDYFIRDIDANQSRLDGADRHRAALSIRAAYSHSLETFFALLAAAVQAPHCPLGWMLQYRNHELETLICSINKGEPIFTITKFTDRWAGLARQFHTFDSYDSVTDDILHDIEFVWSSLAVDFLDTERKQEYNSVKHGLRAVSLESRVALGPSLDGDPPILDAISPFGGHFCRAGTLSADRVHFELEIVQKNWSPIALAARTRLVALSIRNVVGFLRRCIGVSEELYVPEWPRDPSLMRAAWQSESPVHTAIFKYGVVLSPDYLPTKDQIVAYYGLKS